MERQKEAPKGEIAGAMTVAWMVWMLVAQMDAGTAASRAETRGSCKVERWVV